MSSILPEYIRYIEVDVENDESLRVFERFYHEVFIEAFTNEDEIVPYEGFLHLLRKNARNNAKGNDLLVHILIFLDGDEIVGGIVIDYFHDIKTLAVEYIVVAKPYQRRGLATKFYDFVQAHVTQQYGKTIDWIIIEIEDPAFVESGDFSYLYFWKKCNMKKIDFPYIQPALSPDQKPVDILMLCASHTTSDQDMIEISHIKELIALYARHAMGINRPHDDPSVLTMLSELDSRSGDTLRLIDLQGFIDSVS